MVSQKMSAYGKVYIHPVRDSYNSCPSDIVFTIGGGVIEIAIDDRVLIFEESDFKVLMEMQATFDP